MTLQEIRDRIESAIPGHGEIVLTLSIHSKQEFYSGKVHEPTDIEECRLGTPIMAQVVQVYTPEKLLSEMLESYARYTPNKEARKELLRRQLAELEE